MSRCQAASRTFHHISKNHSISKHFTCIKFRFKDCTIYMRKTMLLPPSSLSCHSWRCFLWLYVLYMKIIIIIVSHNLTNRLMVFVPFITSAMGRHTLPPGIIYCCFVLLPFCLHIPQQQINQVAVSIFCRHAHQPVCEHHQPSLSHSKVWFSTNNVCILELILPSFMTLLNVGWSVSLTWDMWHMYEAYLAVVFAIL